MRLFGWNISITKTVPPNTSPALWDRGNWWMPIIREPFIGAWQRNQELRVETIVTYFAVYSCVSLISTDIGKLCLRLMQQDSDGLWQETENSAFSPVLRKPNHFQTRGKFIEQWLVSKLLHGNTYVLKERDNRGVVARMYILDPLRTRPLIAPDGSVFYELAAERLAGLELPISVPASEIIHDVMVPLWHPLCGVSPLLAAALPVAQGMSIQRSSSSFFQNGSRPGGILTAPGPIDETTARRLKDQWEVNFTGDKAGHVAVLGDGLKYEAMGIPAEEAQLIEQLKWTAENVASVFHVPAHMIGIGQPPTYNNIEALSQQYYSQCLQTLIEAIEALLDDGLGLLSANQKLGTEFDLDDLLRMDTATKVATTAESVKAGFLSPNEARARFNLTPTEGGESPYLQQQNYSLAALNRRDEATAAQALVPPPPATPLPASPPTAEGQPIDANRLLVLSRRYLN